MFFVVILSSGCTTCKPNPDWSIRWGADKKARSIDVPYNWVKEVSKDSIKYVIKFVLSGEENKTPIIGTYTIHPHQFSFEPLIPFTNGMTYEVYAYDKKIWDFRVDTPQGPPPSVKAIYPKIDTVPENLLKIYIEFSQPMTEGKSTQHVGMINAAGDTLRNVFLDLQPELWNEDRTVLTLWLDPGRIKRDLQPNLKLGTPLHQKNFYKLYVSKSWPDAQGRNSLMDITRTFVTTTRNETSPQPSKWKITSPPASTKDAAWIAFDKPLDHYLLMECLRIKNSSGKIVKGKFAFYNEDRGCRFTPDQPWSAGRYEMVIDSKLEDLCGNNINRSFDRDVTKTKTPSTHSYHTILFTIR